MTTIAHDFKLPITSEDTLKEFVRVAWGVVIPDTQICERHSTPWRAFADAYFHRSPVSVWFASRGFGGKSFLLSVLANTEAATLGADVNLLGGSGAQSKRVLEHISGLWQYKNAPVDLLTGDAATITRLANGAKIEALMASQASVRGSHPQRLRLDEIDEMDIEILDAAMGQPMDKNKIRAQTVMSSTRQYADGTMTKMLQRAAEKNWSLHEWCWRENLEPHGWLTNTQVEQKKNEVTLAMWNAEYENQEPNPGARAINSDVIDRMFNKSLGEFEGNAHEYIEIEAPVRGARYTTGTDWARKKDWTIIATFRMDVKPARCVAWERTGRLDWPVMVSKLDLRLLRYIGEGLHDGTGIGDVVSGYLTSTSKGFIMAGRDRANLLSEYIAACEKGEIQYPYIKYAYNEHKYAGYEDIYSSGKGHHLPDSFCAGALAWRAGASNQVEYGSNPFSEYRG